MTINNTPKSIDTHYNGYKFRSRTEARWAIFFDELHIAYDYEPQGFDLSGTRYLPDFHLTNGLVLHQFQPTQLDQIWVEIKPHPELSDEERKKMAEFVKQTDHHILLIAGQPDVNATLRFIDHHPETGWFTTDVRWLEMPDGQIGLVPVEKLNNSELLGQILTPRLRQALDKARQSRFEFGQTPTPPLKEEASPKEAGSQETSVDSAPKSNTKICKSCGKEFKPYRQHFIYCTSCYHKQQKQQVQQTAHAKISATSKPKYPTTKTRTTKKEQSNPLRLVGCVFMLFALILVISSTGWFFYKGATEGFFGSLTTLAPTATVTIPATYTPQPTITPQPMLTPVPTQPATATNNEAPCSCTRNTYDCSDFTTQVQAQACFDQCFPSKGDIHFLDGNEDGQACETLP